MRVRTDKETHFGVDHGSVGKLYLRNKFQRDSERHGYIPELRIAVITCAMPEVSQLNQEHGL